jgi:basic amino acid/polyamine antiporter, APA family
VMAVLVLFVDLTGVVAVSTFALLFTYVLANVSAFRLKTKDRLYPRFLPLIGLATCLVLFVTVFFVSLMAWVTGLAFLAAGTVIYFIKKTRFKKPAS